MKNFKISLNRLTYDGYLNPIKRPTCMWGCRGAAKPLGGGISKGFSGFWGGDLASLLSLSFFFFFFFLSVWSNISRLGGFGAFCRGVSAGGGILLPSKTPKIFVCWNEQWAMSKEIYYKDRFIAIWRVIASVIVCTMHGANVKHL